MVFGAAGEGLWAARSAKKDLDQQSKGPALQQKSSRQQQKVLRQGIKGLRQESKGPVVGKTLAMRVRIKTFRSGWPAAGKPMLIVVNRPLCTVGFGGRCACQS
jgi:hypothetical protein